ncbi:MAG: hypothetical protein ACK5QW_07665 [Cyanobacteriota bacterium]
MIHLTLASNAIHLEAARRLRDGLAPRPKGMEVLLWEPNRFALTPADRRRWPLRLPARPASYLLLAPWALLGLVRELRLAHRRGAGVGLRLLLRRAGRITLLDDGLDQYRRLPRAVEPLRFPAGSDCWLFSDAPTWRAPWCARFHCRELGPLYPLPSPSPPSPPDSAPAGDAGPDWSKDGANGTEDTPPGTLIIDSPGLERLREQAATLPHPWCLVPHPVRAKRSWPLPLGPSDRHRAIPPEELLPHWRGTVVVGESLMLLAALRLRRADTKLVVVLPSTADAHLREQVAGALAPEPLGEAAGEGAKGEEQVSRPD